MRRFREERLRRVVRRAYDHVPYYRQLLEKGPFSVHRIRGLSDLSLIPVSYKKDLRYRDRKSLLSDQFNPDRLKTFETTGSTGVPFQVSKSPWEKAVADVLRWRVMRYFGLRLGDRVLRLSTGFEKPWYWRASERLGLHFGCTINLTDSPEVIARTVGERSPDVILGNAGVLTRTARVLESQGGLKYRPRFVVCGAEVLTPGMRQQVERGFDTAVSNSYNCIEMMHPVAWQCRETGLFHVGDDAVILEVLNNGTPVQEGEEGEAVVTSLFTNSMPIIRYGVGDLVVKGPSTCPCGSPFSTLQSIQGRMTDYLILPGGKELFASRLAYAIHGELDWVLQYELVQPEETRVLLRMVVRRSPKTAEKVRLKEALGRILGAGVTLETQIVPELSPGAGSKFRVLRSKLDSLYQPES